MSGVKTEPNLRSLYEWLDTQVYQGNSRPANLSATIILSSYLIAPIVGAILIKKSHTNIHVSPELFWVPLGIATALSAVTMGWYYLKTRTLQKEHARLLKGSRGFVWKLYSARWSGSIEDMIGEAPAKRNLANLRVMRFGGHVERETGRCFRQFPDKLRRHGIECFEHQGVLDRVGFQEAHQLLRPVSATLTYVSYEKDRAAGNIAYIPYIVVDVFLGAVGRGLAVSEARHGIFSAAAKDTVVVAAATGEHGRNRVFQPSLERNDAREVVVSQYLPHHVAVMVPHHVADIGGHVAEFIRVHPPGGIFPHQVGHRAQIPGFEDLHELLHRLFGGVTPHHEIH